MRQITRYVLLDFLKVFLVTLSAMSLMLVVGVIGLQAYKEGLSLTSVARMMPFALPIALLYAIPGTTLFAVCSVYGRMASMNEVIAIKSLGISPMSLIWPICALACFLSVFVVWLNDVAVSWGRRGVERVILESIEQVAYGMLRTQRSYVCKQFSIHVESVVGDKLLHPMMTWHGTDDQPDMVISAEQAMLRCDPQESRLRIYLSDGEVSFGEHRQMFFPDTQVINVPLWAAARRGREEIRPQDTALRRIPREIDDQVARIDRLERSMATEAAFQMLTGDLRGLAEPPWEQRHADLREARSRLCRLHTEPWRRWANGFSCLAFVMVGAPLSVRLRNSDVWTSFALCFVPVLVVYYPLLVYGVKFSKTGELPPYSVWLGNLVFVVVGAWLMRTVIRR
ncbi:MAG: LptF/LptG family permease [Pirellulaceae bacterium]